VCCCDDRRVATRVLIVDDHPSFRRLATRLLREAERLCPDVVLLDVVLPDRSGLAVARELALLRDAPRVVLISSRGRSDFGDSFAWPPRCSFLPKHELTAARLRDALQHG
jgi:CheY-like chemotaxis protein